MKILVTGGAGYIGSVVSRQLLEKGHTVLVIDNLCRGNRDAVPEGAHFIEGDIAHLDSLISKKDKVDVIVHLAAFISAGESMMNPDIYWRNNTFKTFEMLGAMRQLGIKNLVFASTAAVYGNPAELPITEQTEKKPTNTYGMSKLAMDMIIRSESWLNELSAISLRFFNVAGAYKDAGEQHPSESHIIPLAFKAIEHKRPFEIFGDDYPTPDGTCVRDYIHVADLGKAITLCLDKFSPGSHKIYNLGNGRGFSNKEVLLAIERVTGKLMTIHTGIRRPGDPAVLVASSAAAEKELGWTPDYPNIDDIVRDAWEYYKTTSPVKL